MGNLICRDCNKEFSLNEKIWRCGCGGLLDIEFESSFPLDKIKKRPLNIWRYREAIPIQYNENIVSFNEGFTPIVPIEFNHKKVLIKLDYLFPTGSFKDRGASVLISKVKELGIKKVVEDSSGNAGCAISAYSAKGGIECEVFCPFNAPSGKLAQIQTYGAKLQKIHGTREDTAFSAIKRAKNIYYASHYWNPYFIQGTKTFAFEVVEQLGWRSPDAVIIPVGSGSLLLGMYLGFKELLTSGVVEKIPKLIGVQAENCAPLVKAWELGLNEIPKIDKRETIAEGISISEPVRGGQIIEAVKASGGEFISVSESEIKEGLGWICKRGFYIEVTSSVVVPGIKKYLKKADSNEIVVSTFTGHGLKTSGKILEILNKENSFHPTLKLL